MIATRVIACPTCKVRLKIAESLPTGKRINCPKCDAAFAVPAAKDVARAAKGADPRIQKKPAPPPPEEDELDEELEERPRPRKRKLRKKPEPSKAPLVIALVVGILVLVGGGVAAAIIFLPKKKDSVAENTPRAQGKSETTPVQGGVALEGGPRLGGGSEAANAGAPSRPQLGATGGGSQNFAAAMGIYEQKCNRCHPANGGRGRGPDLSGVGTKRARDWLIQYVRDPKSQNPDSKMPTFGRQLSDADLQALGDYLVSLKGR